MFKTILNKKDIITALVDNKDKELVVHYNCEACDDEQVTYKIVDDEIDSWVEQLDKEDYVMVTYNCTNCTHTTKFLNISHMQGIEIL